MDAVANRVYSVFKVTNASQWYEHINEWSDEVVCEKLDDDDFLKEYNKVDEIITLQVSYYAHRHIAGLGGHHSDNLANMETRAKEEYKQMTGKDYVDPNENIDW